MQIIPTKASLWLIGEAVFCCSTYTQEPGAQKAKSCLASWTDVLYQVCYSTKVIKEMGSTVA